jgi:hypothetical protein
LAVAINNYISFGEPALTTLLQVIHQHKSYLLVFSDHETARIWLVALNSIEYEEERRLEWYREDWREMTLMPTMSAGGFVKSGSHRDRYTQRLDEQIERFYREVADRILRLARKHRAAYVVLAGNQEANHRLRRLLPDQTVISPIAIAHYSSSSEVLKKASPLVAAYEDE